MKKRVFIASFQLETNSFAGTLTTLEDYQRRALHYGQKELRMRPGNNTTLGGFYDAFCEMPDVEVLMGPSAVATPGGPLRQADFDEIVSHIVSEFEAYQKEKPVDGCLFAFHGAMMTEDFEDAESEILRRVRKVAGDLPIVLALDFHVNLTQEMLDLTQGIFTSRYYPHLDFNERGQQAARFIYRLMTEEIHPVATLRKLPFIFPIKSTYEEPLKSIIADLVEESKKENVVDATFVAGFYLSDTTANAPAVYTLVEDGKEHADALADQYEKILLSHPEVFEADYPEYKEAVRKAIAFPGLTVFGEGSDNTGSGCYGDDTVLLKELLQQGAKDVGMAYFTDPESAAKCFESGEGTTVHLSLGGKSATAEGTPLEVDSEVLKISEEGKVLVLGPMYHNCTYRLGKSALIRFSGIYVVVATNRCQPMDGEAFRTFGLDPEKLHILVVKSAIHYQAAFRLMTDRVITLAVNDRTPLDSKTIPYKKALRKGDL